MQKLRLIIPLLALHVSLSCYADTCPPVDTIDLNNPPAGWNVLLPPIIDGQTYHFGKAVHSLNISFFYQQVICVYEACATLGCPAFELLSESIYTSPEQKTSPWDARPSVRDTLVCAPASHDPKVCVFD